jgi:hypothetical protein
LKVISRGVVEGSGVQDFVGVQNKVRRPGVRTLVDCPKRVGKSRCLGVQVYIGWEVGGAFSIFGGHVVHSTGVASGWPGGTGVLVESHDSSQGAQWGAAEGTVIGVLAIQSSGAHILLPAASVGICLAFFADSDAGFLFQVRQTEEILVFNTRHSGKICWVTSGVRRICSK